MTLVTRNTCRVCGSFDLTPVLSLGEQRIAGQFANPVQRRIPLELVRCDTSRDETGCGFVQLKHSVPPAILYRYYGYRSGINRTMTENLHGIARGVERMARLTPGDLVVDIGCNDGTLLDGYTRRGIVKMGFDPSNMARFAVEKGYNVVREFYAPGRLSRKAQAITSIAMFYDLEEPSTFVRGVAADLAPKGVWVIELHYLPAILETNGFDTICHEHLGYYSLGVLERLVREHGLEVVSAETNGMNGGSIRLFVGHAGEHRVQYEGLEALRLSEFELALDSRQTYVEFERGVHRARKNLETTCRDLHAEGKRIHVYGASTKGNTILQFAGLDHKVIEAAADRNPEKAGLQTATGIPIVTEEESRAMAPDFYLVLPWHFLDEFRDRESDFLARGGKFIVPLPEVRICD